MNEDFFRKDLKTSEKAKVDNWDYIILGHIL